MRRLGILLAATLLVTPVACSGGDAASGFTVTGEFGRKPQITFPAGEPGALRVETLKAGEGAAVEKDDLVVATYATHRWDGDKNQLVDSSFNKGMPGAFPVGRLIPGLTKALTGQKTGSRVLAAIPPGEAFGERPPQGLSAEDGLVYVLDILGRHPAGSVAEGRQLEVDVPGLKAVQKPGKPLDLSRPEGTAPAEQTRSLLVEGAGSKVKKEQLVVVQYDGRIWRTGKQFDSTWGRGGVPSAFRLGTGNLIKGWDKALTGTPVGSRLLLTIPPGEAYGKDGNAEAGVRGTDTLIFVVDVLGAY